MYSDFTPQKKTNPDGYAVNVAAWEQALNRAAKRGYTSSRGVRVRSASSGSKNGTTPIKRKKTDHLILRTDDSLLRDLESSEWGRPAALGTVFVCLRDVHHEEGPEYIGMTGANVDSLGRGGAQEFNDPDNDLQDHSWTSAEEEPMESHRSWGFESVERHELGRPAVEGLRGSGKRFGTQIASAGVGFGRESTRNGGPNSQESHRRDFIEVGSHSLQGTIFGGVL